MTTISAERLCATPVTSFRPDGSLVDLSRPEPCEVDFDEVAFGLAKIARFTGTHSGPAYSVAQHSVMGAEAIMREERDEMLAALFLLHDGHEYKLGDDSRPKQNLLAAMLEEFSPNSAAAYRHVMARAKAGWDNAIYGAAGLPAPNAWTKRQQQMIARMDIRMMAAEAEALFGSAARQVYPRAKHPEPLTRGAILPWGMAKAEERFLECFDSLIGIKKRHTAKNNHLMHRKGQR